MVIHCDSFHFPFGEKAGPRGIVPVINVPERMGAMPPASAGLRVSRS